MSDAGLAGEAERAGGGGGLALGELGVAEAVEGGAVVGPGGEVGEDGAEAALGVGALPEVQVGVGEEVGGALAAGGGERGEAGHGGLHERAVLAERVVDLGEREPEVGGEAGARVARVEGFERLRGLGLPAQPDEVERLGVARKGAYGASGRAS